MRYLYWIPLFGLLFILPACLTVETITTRIIFDKTHDLYRIHIIYENISSAESVEKDVQSDFSYLIGQAEDESYLLERMEQGFYIKNRRLFLQNDKIMAEEQMIARSPESLYHEFNLSMDSTHWTMPLDDKEDDFNVIEHNGETIESNGNNILIWPRDAGEISWKSRLKQLPEYFERNQKQMVLALKEYLNTTKGVKSEVNN